MRIPDDTEGKQNLLRSLMNVRMPKPASSEVLSVQDMYLKGRALEKGIINISQIETVKESLGSEASFADRISVWHGDTSRGSLLTR